MSRKTHSWIVVMASSSVVRTVVTRETAEEACAEARNQQNIGGPYADVSIWKRETGTLLVRYLPVSKKDGVHDSRP